MSRSTTNSWPSAGGYLPRHARGRSRSGARSVRGVLLGVCALALVAAAVADRSTAASATAGQSFRLHSGPFAGRALYVAPNSAEHDVPDSPWRRWAVDSIADKPQATWLVGGSAEQTAATVAGEVAAARPGGAVTQFVIYDIPDRDCGGDSAGGADSDAAYLAYIDAISHALDGSHAIVVLEPDALAELDCLSTAGQADRLHLLRAAVRRLVQPHVQIYLDAGHAGWQRTSVMAHRLIKAGIYYTRGFALNVANFDATANETAYGTSISAQVGWKRFVIDTSRNGGSDDGDWCNPAGAGLGADPAAPAPSKLVDALLWVKHPGESDGSCGASGLPPGAFDAHLAGDLMNNGR